MTTYRHRLTLSPHRLAGSVPYALHSAPARITGGVVTWEIWGLAQANDETRDAFGASGAPEAAFGFYSAAALASGSVTDDAELDESGTVVEWPAYELRIIWDDFGECQLAYVLSMG